MPFNIPNELISRETYTGCPPGYTLVGNACVNNTTGQIFHVSEGSEYEFEYYENAGELVGRYKLGAIGDPEMPPLYFSQNVSVDTIKSLSINSPSMIMNKEDSALFVDITHYDNDGDQELDIKTSLPSSDPEYETTFLVGEFFLLPNNMVGIKRINLAYDIAQNENTIDDWLFTTGNPQLPGLTREELQPLLEWYIGFARIPSKDRPSNMVGTKNEPITPEIPNRTSGTGGLKWKTLRNTCFSWVRVYDKMGMLEYFLDDIPADGQYVVQIKCVIRKDRLLSFLNNSVDSGLYLGGEQDYRIVIYPPSFYLYPADTVSKTIVPKINAINDIVEEIVFETTNNYKTDGNIHYMIEFLTAKNSGDILFRTSTYDEHDYHEGFQWFESPDQLEWNPISSGLPEFKNSYSESNGSDSEQTRYIKYVLSEDARSSLDGLPNILFRIKQLDGTQTA